MKKIFLICLSLAAVVSCDKDSQNKTIKTETTKIPITVAIGQLTKATETAFESGDKVGIYVVNEKSGASQTLASSGNYVDNMCFSYSDKWTPTTPIYWLDQTTKADFYCYYPYVAKVTDVTAYPISVLTDQSTEANVRKSDFLYGTKKSVSPSEDPVSITLNHSMAKLIITLKAGTGWTDEDMKTATVTVLGLKTTGTINFTTGVVTSTGTGSDITPMANAAERSLLIVPQAINSQKLVKVAIKGNEYVLTQSVTFASNKKYNCELIVNRTSSGINIGIGNWDNDGQDFGGTLE